MLLLKTHEALLQAAISLYSPNVISIKLRSKNISQNKHEVMPQTVEHVSAVLLCFITETDLSQWWFRWEVIWHTAEWIYIHTCWRTGPQHWTPFFFPPGHGAHLLLLLHCLLERWERGMSMFSPIRGLEWSEMEQRFIYFFTSDITLGWWTSSVLPVAHTSMHGSRDNSSCSFLHHLQRHHIWFPRIFFCETSQAVGSASFILLTAF